jgi:hypothetical protein
MQLDEVVDASELSNKTRHDRHSLVDDSISAHQSNEDQNGGSSSRNASPSRCTALRVRMSGLLSEPRLEADESE